MFYIMIKRIVNKKYIALIHIISIVFIFTLIPLGLTYSNEAKLTVTSVLEDQSRGLYDILIRPKDTRTEIEKKFGTVEENYIGDGKGGISIKEWEDISKDSRIEIAAPVSSIGYFRGKSTSIKFPVSDTSMRYTVQFLNFDGVNYYPISEEKSLTYFEKTDEGLQYFLYPYNGEPLTSSSMFIPIPESYFLINAIDIESESALTGIDFSELNIDLYSLKGNQKNKYQEEIQMLQNFNNPPVINVLQRENLTVPLYLKIKKDEINVSLEQYRDSLGFHNNKTIYDVYSNYEEYKYLGESLKSVSVLNSIEKQIEIGSYQKPFQGVPLILGDDFSISESDAYMNNNDTSVYYTAEKIQYNSDGDNLKVEIVENGSPPSYKVVDKQGVSAQDLIEGQNVPFMIVQTGEFSVDNLTQELASSPLGMYSLATTKLGDIELKPTSIPGSFVPSYASGVTTLDAAELIKGATPIDAIRVRVANVEKYDEKGIEHIEKVATDLFNKGYEVDIVAGSSFKKQKIEVEHLGVVNDSWTTLGVSQEISNGWNKFTAFSVTLFSIFSFLYLLIKFIYEKNLYIEENQILEKLGWRKEHILKKNRIEQYLLVTMAMVISIVILGLINAIHLVVLSLSLWLIALIIIRLIFSRRNSPIRDEKRSLGFFKYYFEILYPMILIVTVSFILIGTLSSTILNIVNQTGETTLGVFLLNQTVSFQIIILCVTVLLSLFSISEGLNRLLTERSEELKTYLLIGWTEREVIKLLIKESLLWMLISLASGATLSVILLIILNVNINWMILGILIAFTLSLVPFILMNIIKVKRIISA